jgi:hypothetical protein
VIIFELAWYYDTSALGSAYINDYEKYSKEAFYLLNYLSEINFDEFDSTEVKLYIFIHNEVRDFDKNSTQPEIRDNESQLYNKF